MTRVVIFGNSGSGKSTLALRFAKRSNVKHLDLDTIAWKADQTGVREDLAISTKILDTFISRYDEWVIEGCYASLISIAANAASELIFLNPGAKACQENCRSRLWEPHKYKSKEEQDKNLPMLLKWVADYETRNDEFSLSEHKKLFASHPGKKIELQSNQSSQTFPISPSKSSSNDA